MISFWATSGKYLFSTTHTFHQLLLLTCFRYPTYELQLSRYIGLRAGIMAISQLPVVWIFATRNDPLLWVTGWSLATYNRFHRWVARQCMLLAVVHAICFSIYTWKSGMGLIDYYSSSWTMTYFYCGAMVSFPMCSNLTSDRC